MFCKCLVYYLIDVVRPPECFNHFLLLISDFQHLIFFDFSFLLNCFVLSICKLKSPIIMLLPWLLASLPSLLI